MSQLHDNASTLIASYGEHVVTLADLLKELKYQTSWHFIKDALQRMLIQALFEEHSIEASEEQVDEYMDAFRVERELYEEEEIGDWLEANNMSDEEFYDLCQFGANLVALKKQLYPEARVAETFTYKKLELDTVELYHIIVPSENLAKEILALVREGADFFGMAKKFSTEEATKNACGYMAKVKRKDLRPEIEAGVFSASDGDIVGPFKGTRGFHLYLIDKHIPAELNEEIQQKIVDELFAELINRKLSQNELQSLQETDQE
ncbi:hypothetical protein BH10CYA1_BH10CYA1_03770 [soil metagenome]